jgi:hypothetical protein
MADDINEKIQMALEQGVPMSAIAEHLTTLENPDYQNYGKSWLESSNARATKRSDFPSEKKNLVGTITPMLDFANENPELTLGALGAAVAIPAAIKAKNALEDRRMKREVHESELEKNKAYIKQVELSEQKLNTPGELTSKQIADSVKQARGIGGPANPLEKYSQEKFNTPLATLEQVSGGPITNVRDLDLVGNAHQRGVGISVNALPGTVSNQPAGVPNAVSPMNQLRQPPAVPIQAAQPPAAPVAAPQIAPQPAPVEPVAPPASSVAQRTRRNAEQIAADREALLASAPEGRLPSAPNPKKSNKLMPGDVIGQGGWHWYQGQMGPEAEENWLRTFGRTNVPVKDVQQAMKEGRLAGPVVPEGKQGGAFPREATVPNYIKGHASVGGLLNVAGNALGFVGLEHEYEKAKKTGDWSDFGLGVANQLIGNIAPRLVAPTALMTPGSLNANEEEELARRRKISKIGIAPPGR